MTRWSEYPPPMVEIGDDDPRRRMLTPFDDDALSTYFTTLKRVGPELAERIQAVFLGAIQEGERPKDAVARALRDVSV